MGLPQGLDALYPTGMISTFTLNTTNVVPATARELNKYGAFDCSEWVLCWSHTANLLLLDQLRVTVIAALLAHAKQITLTLRKLFLLCGTFFSSQCKRAHRHVPTARHETPTIQCQP